MREIEDFMRVLGDFVEVIEAGQDYDLRGDCSYLFCANKSPGPTWEK